MKSKLTMTQAEEIRFLAKSGQSFVSLAAKYKVSLVTIHNIVDEKTHRREFVVRLSTEQYYLATQRSQSRGIPVQEVVQQIVDTEL